MRRLQRHGRETGFTLIEILVVVVIIAVVVSLAVLSIGVTGKDRQIEDESRRIYALVGLLHDRALLEGRDFGLLVEPATYRFVVYQTRRDRWEPFDEEREFRLRKLPQGLSLQLELDSRQIVLRAANPTVSSDAAPVAPQIIIAASGEGTPFRLTLVRAGSENKATVSGDSLGKTQVTP